MVFTYLSAMRIALLSPQRRFFLKRPTGLRTVATSLFPVSRSKNYNSRGRFTAGVLISPESLRPAHVSANTEIESSRDQPSAHLYLQSNGRTTLLPTMTFPAHDCEYGIQTSRSPTPLSSLSLSVYTIQLPQGGGEGYPLLA